jgi:hypothetical protein
LSSFDKRLDALDIHEVEEPYFGIEFRELLLESGKGLLTGIESTDSEDELGGMKSGELSRNFEAES